MSENPSLAWNGSASPSEHNGNIQGALSESGPVSDIAGNPDKIIDGTTDSNDLDKSCMFGEPSKTTPAIDVTEPDTSHSTAQEPRKTVSAREGSPLKEAIKGFVRSKLSKKPPPASSDGPHSPVPGERRNLFSGLKEKIARRLEDNTAKETLNVVEEFQTLSSKSHSASELDTIQHLECELKSVVANERPEPVVVEEGEECFEELKSRLSPENIPVHVSGLESDCLPGATPPRSRTMTNISAVSNALKSKSKPMMEKDISVSFSSLKKMDDLDENNAVHHSRKLSAEDVYEPHRSFSVGSHPPAVDCTTPSPVVSRNEYRSDSHRQMDGNIFRKLHTVLFSFFEWLLQLHILALIGAVVVYRVLYPWPFLAGVLCTLLIVMFFLLLYYDFTVFLKQKCSSHFPEYKTLPSFTDGSEETKSLSYQGWMYQLLGDYNPQTYSLHNAVTVFVSVEDGKLTLSYPKKDVPKKQGALDDKQSGIVSFARYERHFLNRAKILLLPDDLRETRVWNKKYPIGIMLPERRRSPSVDSATYIKDTDSDKSTRNPSNMSLPPSLSGSPARSLLKENLIYLFARTNRDKEEWYRVLCKAVGDDGTESRSLKLLNEDGASADSISIVTVPPSPSPSTSSLSRASIPNGKEETVPKPLMPQKPFLNFEQYMSILLDQCGKEENASETASVQWVNVLLGRVFYDFLVQRKWAENVQTRIQNKLDALKMPPYMQKLVVTDVYLGKSLPQIRKTSPPVMDSRGLWIDLEIEYEGYFQMTLETKLKSLQPKTLYESHKRVEIEEPIDTPSAFVRDSPLPLTDDLAELEEEDEDIPEVESAKEDSPAHPGSVSTGVKLLQSVERWVASSNLVENRFVKRCVGHLTQARLVLTVEVNSLNGTLALNIPPLPTNRLWYGFRRNPDKMSLNVYPKVGDRNISLLPVVQLIKRQLLLEFQKALVMPNMDDVVIPIMDRNTEY